MALVSTLSLEGYLNFTFEGADYSNNLVLCATWMATILSLHQALQTDARRWWFSLGLSVGLSALTKYSIALLVAPLIAFTFFEPSTRFIWRRKEVYLAAGAALLIFLPHLIWMITTNFMTAQYALERAAGYQHWFDRLRFPAVFVFDQFWRVLPVLLIIAPFVSFGSGERNASNPYHRRFLTFAFLGPILLLLTTSFVFGLKLIEIWGMPLWSLLGLFVLASGNVRTVQENCFRLACLLGATVVIATTVVFVVRAVWSPAWRGRPMREHYPGQLLAMKMTAAYHAAYGMDPAIIAGDAWIVNSIVCYSWPVPVVYPTPGLGLELQEKYVPWTRDADLRMRGGILVWEVERDGAAMLSSLQNRFPSAVYQPPLILHYQGGSRFASVRVGWALVPPTVR